MGIRFWSVYLSLFLSILSWTTDVCPVLVDGTTIKTMRGMVPVELLRDDDLIIGFHEDGTEVPVKIVKKYQTTGHEFIIIQTPKGKIRAAPGQQFYDARSAAWIQAKDVTTDTVFLTAKQGEHNELLPCTGIKRKGSVSYRGFIHIEVESPHTFFISTRGSEACVLTHNEFITTTLLAAGFTLSWAFSGTAVVFTGAELAGITAAFIGLLYKLFHRQDNPEPQKELGYIPDLDYSNRQRGGEPEGPREPKNPLNKIAGAAGAAAAASKSKDTIEKAVEPAVQCAEVVGQKYREIKDFIQGHAPHILVDRPGHLPDTPENRRAFLDLVANAKNYLGDCARGNHWFGKILETGKQLWANARDGTIRNAGLNDIPREFNPLTGLSSRLGDKK